MLLRLLQEKPERGIAEAISQYGGAVKTIVSSFLQGFSEADVEEVISDVFVKLWRFSGQYQPERGGSLKSYVYQIARNAAIDTRRKLQKSSELEISELFPDSRVMVEDATDSKMLNDIVRDVVTLLTEPDRSIFVLRYYYAMPIRNIAGQLQMTEKSVSHRLARGKEKLKQKLTERGIQYA